MTFNHIYSDLISGKEKLALVGLGYVGMPIAVEFAKHVKVIGFDINEKYKYPSYLPNIEVNAKTFIAVAIK